MNPDVVRLAAAVVMLYEALESLEADLEELDPRLLRLAEGQLH